MSNRQLSFLTGTTLLIAPSLASRSPVRNTCGASRPMKSHSTSLLLRTGLPPLLGNRVQLHFLLNAQSGLCPEDCHYCSQSKNLYMEIEKYPLAKEKILNAAEHAMKLKAGTFCMVISGRTPTESIFSKVLDAVRVKVKYNLKSALASGS